MAGDYPRDISFGAGRADDLSPYIFAITPSGSDKWAVSHISREISRYGYRAQDFISGRLCLSDIIHPGDFDHAAEALRSCEEGKKDVYEHFFRLVSRDKNHIWVSDTCTLTRDAEGTPVCWEHQLSDHSHFKRLKEKSADGYGREAVLSGMLRDIHNPSARLASEALLKKTGELLGLSRAVLLCDRNGGRSFAVSCEWTGEGVISIEAQSHGAVYDYVSHLPGVIEDISEAGRCALGAEQLSVSREGLLRGATAAAFFPVKTAGSERYGICCFQRCSGEMEWREDELSFLDMASAILSAAIAGAAYKESSEASISLLEESLEAVSSLVAVVESEHNGIIFANKKFRDAFGETCLSKRCWDVIHGAFTEDCIKCIENELGISPDENVFEMCSEKHKTWFKTTRSLIKWTDGREARLICLDDISVKKQSEDRVEKLSGFDHLTGLPNRRSCETALGEAVSRAVQRGREGYVLIADIDDFRISNDGYGHDYGDALLIEISTFLKSLVTDRVSVFRFGGDAFAIIMEEFSEQKANALITKLQNRTRRSWIAHGRQFFLSLSIGLACFPDNGKTVGSVLKNAETAMFEAKKAGKNRAISFFQGMEHATERRAELERMLRDSINNNFEGFEVHYQFCVDMKDGGFIGAEALLRLYDRLSGELVMPGEFIPLADRLGLIQPLGKFVLRSAMRICRHINNCGHPDFSVTVNVCLSQLIQPDFAEDIHWLLTETGVSPRNIIFDISGGDAEGFLKASGVLKGLRSMGIRVSLDGFGGGASTLECLRDLPADMIKIDGSFACQSGSGLKPEKLISMMSNVGHLLGLKVCLKGLETDEQLKICREAGVDFLQGFYYHSPSSQDEMLELLSISAVNLRPYGKGN